MSDKPFLLEETSLKTIRNNNYNIAILPWGATEAHNYHLPYGTDTFESIFIAKESAKIAWEHGVKVIVLPAIPFGVNTQQLDINLTINMNPSTQALLLSDIIESLEYSKIEKFIILNGHGGNNFKQMIRELQKDTDIFLIEIDWFKVVDEKNYFTNDGDHANEMETSVMLSAFPELVLPLEEAGNGESKYFKLKGFKEKWAWAPRKWTEISKDTGVGNPKLATDEKGKKYLNDVTKKIAEFIIDLSNTKLNNLYE